MNVKVFQLKHHPLNEKIYSLSGLDSLMECINPLLLRLLIELGCIKSRFEDPNSSP